MGAFTLAPLFVPIPFAKVNDIDFPAKHFLGHASTDLDHCDRVVTAGGVVDEDVHAGRLANQCANLRDEEIQHGR